MINSDFAIIKKVSEAEKEYHQLLESFNKSKDNLLFTSENVNKIVLEPVARLTRSIIPFSQSAINGISNSNHLLGEKLSLNDVFEVLKLIPQTVVSTTLHNFDGNSVELERIQECVTNGDFEGFKRIFQSSQLDFAKFERTIRWVYLAETDDEKDILGLRAMNSLDSSSIYYFLRSYFYRDTDVIYADLEAIEKASGDNEIKGLRSFIDSVVNQAQQSFPSIEECESTLDVLHDWVLNYNMYCSYVNMMMDLRFSWPMPISGLVSRMLWNPLVINYILRWSNVLLFLTEKNRIIKPGFFKQPVSHNSHEYFVNLSPKFIQAGIDPLARFMELCPLKDYDNKYVTFIYRLTGRMRPEQQNLSTDMLFNESGPYIYYFIKGITVDNPEQPEDVYGKMKKFFSTTEFPEEEKDIPEPCDAWKEALAELYPDIFGETQTRKEKIRTVSNIGNGLPVPDGLYKEELTQISEVFAPGVHAEQLYYPNENTEFPLTWKGDWGRLAYMIRVLYCGCVRGTEIVPEYNVPSNIWDIVQENFIRDGKSPKSLKTSSWKKLHETHGPGVDSRLIPILKKRSQ